MEFVIEKKQNSFSNKISTFYDGIAKTRKKWIEKGSFSYGR